MRSPPVAYASDGRLLATAEGSLVLVCDGESEGPLFLSKLDGDVVSIAIDAGHVFALSSRGLLVEFDDLGERVNEWSTNASRGVVSAGGRICAYGPKATLFHGSERRELDVDRVSAAALSPDGKKLLVCSELATAQIFDTATATLLGESKGPGPFAGAAWSAAGHFIATVQARTGGVGKIDPTNGSVSPPIGTGEHRLDSVSASADGRFIAARVEDGRFLIFDAAGNRPVGNLAYSGHGDANKIDLSTASVHRTDPHEGRTRHRWSLLADIDVARVNAILDGAGAEMPGATARPGALAGAVPRLASRSPDKAKVQIVTALILLALWALLRLLRH